MSHSSSHPFPDLQNERNQFQLERLILFSDAVFAIAITLLVLEIRIPEIEQSNDTTAELKKVLLSKLPEIFGFILSFAVIGQFWTNHHKLFGYVKNYNGGLLWLNLFYLLWIVFVPFTSSLNSKYGNLNFVWQLYSLNLFMISVSLLLLFRYVSNPKNQLSDLVSQPVIRKYSLMRSTCIALIFLLGALLPIPGYDFLNYGSRCIFFLIPFTIMYINKKQRKALNSHSIRQEKHQ